VSFSRILAPAAAVWGGALTIELIAKANIGNVHGLSTVMLIAAPTILIASLVIAWRFTALRTSWWPAAVAGAALGALAASIHVGALMGDPLAGWASQHRTAEVTGVVASEGVPVLSNRGRLWQQAPQLQWQLSTSTVTVRGEPWRIELPVQVVGSVRPPPIGALVSLSGQLSTGQLPVTAARVRLTSDVQVLRDPGPIDAVANAMRAGLRRALIDRPTDSAALVAGLAIGDQTMQSPELANAMRTAGLAHLTAVSGGNVAIVVVLVLGLARLARLRLRAQVLVALVALTWFVILVRPQPSVLRAAVMGSVVLVGLLTGGQRRGTGVLAVSVALLVVIAPDLAASWGFALSVMATLGLIAWSPMVIAWLTRVLPRWPPGVREALAVTITAQLSTLPLLIAMGSTIGLAGVPANLLAMPVVPVITILGLVTAALGPLIPAAAVLTGLIASWFAGWIAKIAFIAQDLPFAVVPWPGGILGALLSIAGAGAVAFAWRWSRRGYSTGFPRALQWSILGGAGLVVCAVILLSGHRGWPPDGWVLAACDVGQGDGLVVHTGERAGLLIDTGLDAQVIDACLDDLGISVLDGLVITHFHADHVGGLSGALRDREVKAAYATPLDDPPGEATGARRLLAQRGMDFQVVRAGERQASGSASWQVLWPARIIHAGSMPNNASIVLLVEISGLHILLPGDIEPEAQAAVMAAHPSVRADIAKVPHHGSRYQDPGFAEWAGARLTIISVGRDNDYGHPAASTIAQWQQAGSQVMRTDQLGTIAVIGGADGGLRVVSK